MGFQTCCTSESWKLGTNISKVTGHNSRGLHVRLRAAYSPLSQNLTPSTMEPSPIGIDQTVSVPSPAQMSRVALLFGNVTLRTFCESPCGRPACRHAREDAAVSRMRDGSEASQPNSLEWRGQTQADERSEPFSGQTSSGHLTVVQKQVRRTSFPTRTLDPKKRRLPWPMPHDGQSPASRLHADHD